jgi:hypothetical protein
MQTVSVCDLQNNPTAYLSKTLFVQGAVSFSGTNYYLGNGNFYLEDQGCKIQVSSWAPIEVAQCPSSASSCSSSSVMADYVGKSITLNGQLDQQSDTTGTYYVFQGKPVSSSTSSVSGVATTTSGTGTAVASSSGTAIATPITGGQCSYRSYVGVCKVIGLSSPETINLHFTPANEPMDLEGTWAGSEADITGRDWWGLPLSGAVRLWSQTQQKSVQVGNSYSCNIQIETGGTCTPALFTFNPLTL